MQRQRRHLSCLTHRQGAKGMLVYRTRREATAHVSRTSCPDANAMHLPVSDRVPIQQLHLELHGRIRRHAHSTTLPVSLESLGAIGIVA